MIIFRLDQKSSVPFYKQIIDQIRCGISSKNLRPGEQLPTVRELAVTLEVNPNTIRKAYSDLEIRGILNTQQGTGTFVGDKKVQIDKKEKKRILKQICDEFVAQGQQYNISINEIISHLSERI